MKKTILILTAIVSVLFTPLTVLSADSVANTEAPIAIPESPAIQTVAPQTENAPAEIEKENRVSQLTALALRLTNLRVSSLTLLKNRIQKQKNLSDSQKLSLAAEIDAQIAAMNKISGDVKAGGKDAQVLRVIIKSIYSDYRIYAVFIPKIHLESALNAQTNHADKFDELFAKFQKRLDEIKETGADVSLAQKKLDDTKTLKNETAQKIANTLSAVSAFQPSDFPNKSKQEIADTRKAVKEIAAAFKSINNLLKEVNKLLAGSRQSTIKTVKDGYASAVKTANNNYKAAFKSAQLLTDKEARKTALKAARDAMQEAKKSALAKMKEKTDLFKKKK